MKLDHRFFVCLFVIGGAISANAVSYYVAQNGQTPGNFLSWDAAASNIQDAVNAAALNDTVWVGAGHYYAPAVPSNHYGPNVVYVSKLLTLRSSNSVPASTIIDGGGVNRGIAVNYLAASTTRFVLDGFTLSNCVVTSTSTDTNYGAGLSITGPHVWTAAVQNCIFTDNKAISTDPLIPAVGGGMWCYTAVNFGMFMSNCVFRGNTATNTAATKEANGGGFRVGAMGAKLIADCLFEDNSAGSQGGGASTTYGTTEFRNCVFRGNWLHLNKDSGSGGGAYWGSATFRNCLMHNNSAVGSQGGAVNTAQNGPLYFYNCTIVSNRAGTGGGVRGRRVTDVFTMVNTIVYANSPSDISSFGTSTNFYTSSCVGNTNGMGVVISSNLITNNPLFASLVDQNFRLTGGSPCINTGTNQVWWMDGAVDLDGNPRISPVVDGTVDMGAYEFPIQTGSVFTIR